MPITTKTIGDTINFCKRLSFNRNPVIGNSLEPALTAAQLVMDTILSPPFTWWWNNLELVFTANPTPTTATATNIAITAGVLTVTATNTFVAGNQVIGSGFTYAPLNGFLLQIATASPTGFTALVPFQNLSSVADAGVETNVTTQDYTIVAPQFSHIEHASILDLDAAGVPTKWWELTVKNNLALESSQNRPEFIGPHVEDGAGNMTFRLFSSPDKKYPVSLHVQLSPPILTSINQTWAPLPDFMESVFTWGFMALIWQFADDPRSQYANNKFTAGLLARASGLTEEERNIFLNNWDMLTQNQVIKSQQGNQARAM